MNEENRIVEVEFTGPDQRLYKSVGVLMWERNGITKIGFNARNDEVKDALEIPNPHIVTIREVPQKEIKDYK